MLQGDLAGGALAVDARRGGRLAPADVGLANTGTRRVSGLRREEVAQLAAISTDYYTRIEQGRLAPSPPVLTALEVDVEALQVFAEFGVVMMLFLIGLELESRQLWGMRKRLLGLGGMQIAGTTAALFVLGLVLNQTWQVALTLGLILALSSTAIVLQTLSEKSLM